nr:putative capsid protein [Picobirnavirus sp.]
MNRNKKVSKKYLDGKANQELKEEYSSIPNARNKKFGDNYVGKRNDLSWYTVNEQVLKDVARIPYAQPTGTPIFNDGTCAGITIQKQGNYDLAVAGLVTMEIMPTIGNAKEAMDPVNAAANGQFTYLRSQVTGSIRFEQNDVMIYNIVVDSVYYYVAWLYRLYSSLPMYHQASRYVPRTIIEAQGVDYDDLLENAAKFRAEVNKRMPLIGNLKIPKALYIFPRHKWLFENYFIEGETEKAQLYCYRPAGIYMYQLDSVTGAGMAKAHRILAGATGQGGRLTTADMIRKLDAMLNPIYDDEFFNLISGYMEKGYNDFITVDPLPDQPILPIVYSPDVLLQFKNAKTCTVKHSTIDSGYEDGFFDIKQVVNPGSNVRMHLETLTPTTALQIYRELPVGTAIHVDSLSQQNIKDCYQGFLNEWSKYTLLTSPHANVEPGENMINTRLTLAMDLEYDTNELANVKINKLYFGSEWPLEIQVWSRFRDRSDMSIKSSSTTWNTVMVCDLTHTFMPQMFTRRWPLLSKFKYLPELKIVTNDGNDTYMALESIFEVDNYTNVDAQTIGLMHDAALLAEFRLPEIAMGK